MMVIISGQTHLNFYMYKKYLEKQIFSDSFAENKTT